jgi:hypothetical protein
MTGRNEVSDIPLLCDLKIPDGNLPLWARP